MVRPQSVNSPLVYNLGSVQLLAGAFDERKLEQHQHMKRQSSLSRHTSYTVGLHFQ